MIKNLIFDVYGTLVSTGNGSVMATAEIFREFGLEAYAVQIYKKWKLIHKKNIIHIEKFVTEKEIFIDDLRHLFSEMGINASPERKVSPMIDSLYGRKLFPDVDETMGQILSKYNVAIGSTTDNVPLLDSINGTVLEKIEQIYTSERLQKYKPNPEFYYDIINMTGWKIEETIFVGDSIEDDVIGPNRIGMKTVLVNRKSIKDIKLFEISDAVIHSFDELLSAIEEIEKKAETIPPFV